MDTSETIGDIRFIYFLFINLYDEIYNYQCDCGKIVHDCKYGDINYADKEIYKEQLQKYCKFNIEDAIEIIHKKLAEKQGYDDSGDILIEYNNGKFLWSSYSIFTQDYCIYNYLPAKKELFCEKCRRGYLDELPTDIWNIIKKYIIYS